MEALKTYPKKRDEDEKQMNHNVWHSLFPLHCLFHRTKTLDQLTEPSQSYKNWFHIGGTD